MKIAPSNIWYVDSYNNGHHQLAGVVVENRWETKGSAAEERMAYRACECCGLYPAVDGADVSFSHNGALVALDSPTPAMETDKMLVEKVVTQNGTLTFGIRHAW